MSLRQQGLLGWLLPDPIDVAIAAYVAACEADDEGRAAAWAELRARGATCADYVARSERHLASEVGSTRRNASRLLATFVREAPPPPDDCAALAAFCAARADDAPSAEHALRALADVVEAARRGTGEGGAAAAAAAALCLFGDGAVRAPAFPRAARERFFDAQRAVLDGKAAELAAAASNEGAARFARGVAAAVDGERDPRCLLRALGAARGCGRAADTIGWGDAAAAAGLAAALSPYFPVSFVAPARNPHGVTAVGLREALRAALTAAPELASEALDLALECLRDTGASPDEIGEALTLAARAAEVCPEASLEATAEELMKAVAAVASTAPAPAAAAAQRLAARAWHRRVACARGLRIAARAATASPASRAARAAAQVLAAVASAGPRAWRAVVAAIAPALGAMVTGGGADAAPAVSDGEERALQLATTQRGATPPASREARSRRMVQVPILHAGAGARAALWRGPRPRRRRLA